MPGSRLCMADREEIRAGLERGDSIRVIARFLGRAASTISREIHRNRSKRGRVAHVAHRRARHRARRPKPFKLVTDAQLGVGGFSVRRWRSSHRRFLWTRCGSACIPHWGQENRSSTLGPCGGQVRLVRATSDPPDRSVVPILATATPARNVAELTLLAVWLEAPGCSFMSPRKEET